MNKLKYLLIFSTSVFLYACRASDLEPVDIADVEGNIYNTVVIGNQLWMKQNLRTTKYSDGTPIKNIKDDEEWRNIVTNKKPGYCWMHNDSVEYSETYGALYTWYAVDRNSNGDKNVCPEGWHVPTRGEWKALVRHLGGEAKAGAELKEAGWEHWREMNYDATNKSGFTALPAGERADYKNNNFISLGYHTCFWSQNKYDDKEAYILSLDNNSSNAYVTDYPMQWGLSIRCLKN